MILLTIGCQTGSDGPPYSPEEALSTFQLADGFQIELVAAEPLIADPVAMDIDEYGRIFVAEMPGYPLDASGSGRIKLLRDTNGDGRPDASILFADGLRLPTGLMRWKQGVLVTDPPDLIYLADTDNDGIADVRTVILSGFALSNAQHNANKPLYGPDNWIYVANNAPISWTVKYADPFGDLGIPLFFPADTSARGLPRNGNDRNIRLKPDTFQLEALSSRSQFGQTFDPWGRHFLVDNSNHQYHEVIAARYFGNNPRLAVAEAIHRTPDHGNAARVFPITHNPEHQLLTDRGVFTSACGLTWYAGGLFPAPYDANVTFVAEPVHNLVHVDRVVPDGPVFTAQRIEDRKEFLASTDSWFRPVNFSVGPDGALYVVDYYRQIVEHPEWMDDETAESDDLTRGTESGRIYRVVPADTPPMAWHDEIDLATLPSDSLANHLASRNRWWRMQAQRLLVARQDASVSEALDDMVETSPYPESRVHALWTLDGLSSLSSGTVRHALADSHPGVRENALILAEQFLRADPSIWVTAAALESDPDPRVRFQLINTLGFSREAASASIIERLLWQDVGSDWVQTAALLALGNGNDELLAKSLARTDLPQAAGDRLVEWLSAMIAEDLGLQLTLTQPGPRRAARLSGAALGLERSSTRQDVSIELVQELVSLALSDADAEGSSALRLLRQLELPLLSVESDAIRTVLDSTHTPATRSRSVELMALTGSSLEVIGDFLSNSYPAQVQSAVIMALQDQPGLAPAQLIQEQWSTLTPRIRHEALDIFKSQDRAELLVSALEAELILPTELAWRHRVRLMRDTQEPVRSRARALLQLPAERAPGQDVSESGDAANGQMVFLTHCSQCHIKGDAGAGTYGPDLATVQHWSMEAILNKIQDPNRSVASGYEQWQVQLTSGESFLGILAAETPTTVTVQTLARTRTLRRDQIERMTPVTSSGMPPDLNLAMTEKELADLLTFLTE